MRIAVLGKSPSWQDAGGACSGYLVRAASVRLLLDCGNGVFSKLRQACDYAGVDAVVISHMHADHFLDLVPFSYALLHGPRRPRAAGSVPAGAGPAGRPRLFVPPGGTEVLALVTGAWGSGDLVQSAFDVREYAVEAPLGIGPVNVRFCPVPHAVPSHAIELAEGGSRFTFGADCAPSADLCAFARDTDLLLIEATLTEPEPQGPRAHLTAREAGEHGRRARARRLVVTHFSDELDAESVQAEATAGFGGAVELAREGAVYHL